MASRKLSDLIPEMEDRAEKVIQYCNEKGLDLLIYCTLRSLEEQAKLYRQSRSWSTIEKKIEKFNNRGFKFLADILEGVGPCSGPHVTNAAPGESWHGYAEAFDAVPVVGGKLDWAYDKSKEYEEWEIYGKAVLKAGLVWAGAWKSFKEFPHAQFRFGSSNPLKIYTPDQVYDILRKNGLI